MEEAESRYKVLVFDTSVLISIVRGKKSVFKKLSVLSSKYQQQFYVAFPTRAEFLFGLKKKSIENRRREITFLNRFDTLHTTELTAGIMYALYKKYGKRGKVFSFQDLLIAALAIENNMFLVTEDKAFLDIIELNVEEV